MGKKAKTSTGPATSHAGARPATHASSTSKTVKKIDKKSEKFDKKVDKFLAR